MQTKNMQYGIALPASTAFGKSYSSLAMDELVLIPNAAPKNGLPPKRFAALNPIKIGDNMYNGTVRNACTFRLINKFAVSIYGMIY